MEDEIELLNQQIKELKIENEKSIKQIKYLSSESIQTKTSVLKNENNSNKKQVLNSKLGKKSKIVEIIEKTEKIHQDINDIKYLFCEKKGTDKLIITFPGFSEFGSFKYTYVRTLKDVNAHRLFILDNFGSRGCYLLGQNRNFTVEKSVISLINSIIKKYDINKENVILQGSSKGGWIALYYGIKYGFGYVISGGPQTKIGEFLLRHEVHIPSNGKIPNSSKASVAEYISGGHEEEDMKYLDHLLFDLLDRTDKFPKIYIHIGKGDFHYEKHIIPLMDSFKKNNIEYQLDIEEYNEHNDLAIYYTKFLLKTLNSIDCALYEYNTYDNNK